MRKSNGTRKENSRRGEEACSHSGAEGRAQAPEEKPAENKQTDDNGTADKPDESKAEDKKDDKPEEKADKPESEPAPAVPDAKDEEILRLKTQIAAMSLGVKPDCMDDAVAIAESYVKSGKKRGHQLRHCRR